MTARHDGRAPDALRPIEIETGFQRHPLGSALIRVGNTHVICACSVDERVPGFLVGAGKGWVTAEYAMLPSATDTRFQREIKKGRPSGRTMEIQRLIGRAMRSVVDMQALGERTLWIDCDVLSADGGTRTASVTGGFVAMALALRALHDAGQLKAPVLRSSLAAVSVGVVSGAAVLDLDYVEDSAAEVDMNVVRTGEGAYVEVQGTAEGQPFPRAELDAMLELADGGIDRLIQAQLAALGGSIEGL